MAGVDAMAKTKMEMMVVMVVMVMYRIGQNSTVQYSTGRQAGRQAGRRGVGAL